MEKTGNIYIVLGFLVQYSAFYVFVVKTILKPAIVQNGSFLASTLSKWLK